MTKKSKLGLRPDTFRQRWQEPGRPPRGKVRAPDARATGQQLWKIRQLGQTLGLRPMELVDLAWKLSAERVERIEELTVDEARRAIASLLRRVDAMPMTIRALARPADPASNGSAHENAPVREHQGVDCSDPTRVSCEPSREPLQGPPA